MRPASHGTRLFASLTATNTLEREITWHAKNPEFYDWEPGIDSSCRCEAGKSSDTDQQVANVTGGTPGAVALLC